MQLRSPTNPGGKIRAQRTRIGSPSASLHVLGPAENSKVVVSCQTDDHAHTSETDSAGRTSVSEQVPDRHLERIARSKSVFHSCLVLFMIFRTQPSWHNISFYCAAASIRKIAFLQQLCLRRVTAEQSSTMKQLRVLSVPQAPEQNFLQALVMQRHATQVQDNLRSCVRYVSPHGAHTVYYLLKSSRTAIRREGLQQLRADLQSGIEGETALMTGKAEAWSLGRPKASTQGGYDVIQRVVTRFTCEQ